MHATVFADDATGSLEAGALLAALGIDTAVTLPDANAPPALEQGSDVAVIDTETRHAPETTARGVLGALAAQAANAGVRWIYKKTDSTLRGHIGAELSAVKNQFPGVPLVYVPAYPAVGRTVTGGVLHVNGTPLHLTDFRNDPRSRPASASIPELLRAQGCMDVTSIRSPGELANHLRPEAICVCDAETDQDLRRIGDALVELRQPILCAGPAGFIPIWAKIAEIRRGSPPPIPKVSDFLLVCGSLHPMSRLQASHAARSGIPVILSSEDRSADADTVADELARKALDHIRRHEPSSVIVFGGDTAVALCRALGIFSLIPLGEILPGVPVCRASLPHTPVFLTKAGGYGAPDLLQTIQERMAN